MWNPHQRDLSPGSAKLTTVHQTFISRVPEDPREKKKGLDLTRYQVFARVEAPGRRLPTPALDGGP